MCFVAFPSSPLVTSKRINFHRKTRATEATSSLLSSVHTYFHGSTPKGFLSLGFTTDGRTRTRAGEPREGGANGNGTTTSTGEEKKQKRRRRATLQRLRGLPRREVPPPKQGATAMSSKRFRDFPLGIHFLYSSRCTGSSARPPPPGTLRAPGRRRRWC